MQVILDYLLIWDPVVNRRVTRFSPTLRHKAFFLEQKFSGRPGRERARKVQVLRESASSSGGSCSSMTAVGQLRPDSYAFCWQESETITSLLVGCSVRSQERLVISLALHWQQRLTPSNAAKHFVSLTGGLMVSKS